ncbi:hypothetical protein DFH11DRAFT_1269901 [Phellopilus nigrolimitatus]|nr:hypothetical protein DFH11DRAFT_1269901 [Phellopilus nigrolimitatus]
MRPKRVTADCSINYYPVHRLYFPFAHDRLTNTRRCTFSKHRPKSRSVSVKLAWRTEDYVGQGADMGCEDGAWSCERAGGDVLAPTMCRNAKHGHGKRISVNGENGFLFWFADFAQNARSGWDLCARPLNNRIYMYRKRRMSASYAQREPGEAARSPAFLCLRCSPHQAVSNPPSFQRIQHHVV